MNDGKENLIFDDAILCKRQLEIAQSTMDSLESAISGFSPRIFVIEGYIAAAKTCIKTAAKLGGDLPYKLGGVLNTFLEEDKIYYLNEKYIQMLIETGTEEDWVNFLRIVDEFGLELNDEHKDLLENGRVMIDGVLLEFSNEWFYDEFYIGEVQESPYEATYQDANEWYNDLEEQLAIEYSSPIYHCYGGETIEFLPDGSVKMQKQAGYDADGNILYVDMTPEEAEKYKDYIGEAQQYYSDREQLVNAIDILKEKLKPKWELEEQIGAVISLSNDLNRTYPMHLHQKEMASENYQNYRNENKNNIKYDMLVEEYGSRVEYLSEEEQLYLQYNSENGGKEAGTKYLTDIEEELNRREGEKAADNLLEELVNSENIEDLKWDLIAVGANGVADGVVTFAEGLWNVIAADGKMSVNEYKQMYIINALTRGNYDEETLKQQLETGQITEKQYELYVKLGKMDENAGTSIIKWFNKTLYGSSVSIGNQTIPMIVNTVTGGAGGTILMGLSSYGNNLEGNYQEGYTGTGAYLNAVINAAIEVLPEMMGGGTNVLARGGYSGITATGITQYLKTTVKDVLGEVSEELLQAFAQKLVDTYSGKNVDWSLEKLREEGLDTIAQTCFSVVGMSPIGKGVSYLSNKANSLINMTGTTQLSTNSMGIENIIEAGLSGTQGVNVENSFRQLGTLEQTAARLSNEDSTHNLSKETDVAENIEQEVNPTSDKNLVESNTNISPDNQTTILNALRSAVNIRKAATEALKTVSESQQKTTTESTTNEETSGVKNKPLPATYEASITAGLKKDLMLSYQTGEISYGEYSNTANQLDNFENLYNSNSKMNNGKNSEKMIENLTSENLNLTDMNNLLSDYSETLKKPIIEHELESLFGKDNQTMSEKEYEKLADLLFFESAPDSKDLLRKVNGVWVFEQLISDGKNDVVSMAIRDASPEVLLAKIDGQKTFLEILFEKVPSWRGDIRAIQTNAEVLKIFIDNRKAYETATLTEFEEMTKEEYAEKERNSYSFDAKDLLRKVNGDFVFELIMEQKLNNLNGRIQKIITNASPEVLLAKIDGQKTFLEILFEKIPSWDTYIEAAETNVEVLKICLDNRKAAAIIAINYVSDLNPAIFEDKARKAIIQNHLIGNTPILKLFSQNTDALVNLINKDLLDGFKYSYENILESHSVINDYVKNFVMGSESHTSNSQLFSIELIKNVGVKTLKKIYSTYSGFLNEIVKMASFGNYELIQDLTNYDLFRNTIKSADYKKNIIEIFEPLPSNRATKIDVFFRKYLGTDAYVQRFLDAINKLDNLPNEFMEKYGSILQLLNRIVNSTDEELANLSKTLDPNRKYEYEKLINECEKDGNEILKQHFVNDLKFKNQQIIDTAEHKEIVTNDGGSIDVYELSGQPFKMLVHAVYNNPNSRHNSYVSQITEDPQNWSRISRGNNYLSTSLISDKHLATYNAFRSLVFGFYNISPEVLKITNYEDTGMERDEPLDKKFNMRTLLGGHPLINTIALPDDLIEASRKNKYNEVVLTRSDITTGRKIMPDFVVCVNTISADSINAARAFNIPIYLINTSSYGMERNNISDQYIAKDDDTIQ